MLEFSVRFPPELKLIEDDLSQFVKSGEVTVMSTQTACHLPDSFYGIEVRAVRWQEIKTKHFLMFLQPRLKGFRMVVARVVHDNDHLAPDPKMAQELLQ